MTVCVNNQHRLATWDHDLAGAGSLTDEHMKKIHGDWLDLCAFSKRSSEQDFMRSEKEIKCEL